MSENVTIYFDYLCPFAWRAAEMLEMFEDKNLNVHWKHFSLYQGNYDGEKQWQLWNDKIDKTSDNGGKGLLPFLASCAARHQGKASFHQFRLELLRARHRDCKHFHYDDVMEVAAHVGLHSSRFEQDLRNPECRTMLAHEHFQAQVQHVFGTPTFVFENGHAAYFRIKELPKDAEEARRLFYDFKRMLECYPYLETMKRPRPKGN